MTYKTPGVFIEEIPKLPPSVAAVSTAVPAFLGHTAKGVGTVERITSMLEFTAHFGGSAPSAYRIEVTTDADGNEIVGEPQRIGGNTPKYLLHYALDLYFKNGGGPCWVVSVGGFEHPLSKEAFSAGLDRIHREDEPTLLVLSEATGLDAADYHGLCQEALAQCNRLQDRFAILDVQAGGKLQDKVAAFRSGVGTNHLAYAAAYCPHLETSLTFAPRDDEVEVVRASASGSRWTGSFGGLTVEQSGSAVPPKVQIVAGSAADPVTFAIDPAVPKLTITNTDAKTGEMVDTAFDEWVADGNAPHGFSLVGNATDVPATDPAELAAAPGTAAVSTTLAALRDSETALYNQIRLKLRNLRVTLPPSPAVAGVYAATDRDRGVWKAPANVSLASVLGPVVKITAEEQEGLNVDTTGGKSINAIRAFAGKGTLVWGARTLAGNDNEWRYVPVRRLFIMIEESAKKASAFAVFELNDANSWLKVKGMLESFLYGLWEQGALQGSTPDQAYYVDVGLGRTMTTQDVLEGRMIVEIGIAAVRPAEFIVLQFMHKLPEA